MRTATRGRTPSDTPRATVSFAAGGRTPIAAARRGPAEGRDCYRASADTVRTLERRRAVLYCDSRS
ncbi:hypothetical protein [Nocardia alni]|uniref:hypothetical protein n=1 Tax=Nocardia alni TaxID=2815723 RepID=UPI001C23328F|nr:hypothetical protein [Nocardia alni]